MRVALCRGWCENEHTFNAQGITLCLPIVSDQAIAFASAEGAQVLAFPATIFVEEVLSLPETAHMWCSVLVAYESLMTAVCADLAPIDVPEMGACEMYGPGDAIIRQGDRADYVFNMRTVEAEALVSGVKVGFIGQGEIFGAMAALTHSDRSATVRALSDCVV
ncbi:MAG: CRP/FNR family cyclic AMP-dependent transcriptional regulator [Bacteroidia bacterium]|jgi:CRP/FNR family cyclic AMP-dependent transcriptional regulator